MTPHALLDSSGTAALMDGGMIRMAGLVAGDDDCGCCPSGCTPKAGGSLTYTVSGHAKLTIYDSGAGLCNGAALYVFEFDFSYTVTGNGVSSWNNLTYPPTYPDDPALAPLATTTPFNLYFGNFLTLNTTVCRWQLDFYFQLGPEVPGAAFDGVGTLGDLDARTNLPNEVSYANTSACIVSSNWGALGGGDVKMEVSSITVTAP